MHCNYWSCRTTTRESMHHNERSRMTQWRSYVLKLRSEAEKEILKKKKVCYSVSLREAFPSKWGILYWSLSCVQRIHPSFPSYFTGCARTQGYREVQFIHIPWCRGPEIFAHSKGNHSSLDSGNPQAHPALGPTLKSRPGKFSVSQYFPPKMRTIHQPYRAIV